MCPAGHTLKHIANDLPCICISCNGQSDSEIGMWKCRTCDFDLCDPCKQGKNGLGTEINPGQHLLALIKKEEPNASTEEEQGTLDSSFDVDSKNDREEAWSMWSDSTAPSEDLMANLEQTFRQGDEILPGPDGELYEIFYPPDCVPEDLVAAAADTPSRNWTLEACLGLASESSDTGTVQIRRQTSAEIGIAAMVTFMSQAAVSQYPSRRELFETVQSAAAMSLGKYFQRFALVGSTALGIDTPESDLDAVVFTQSCRSKANGEVPAPDPSQALRGIAHCLFSNNTRLKLQLVDCTRVPVLTVSSADCMTSVDLTVDEPLGEYHVLWFQSQQVNPFRLQAPMHSVPSPSPDGWAQGLEVAAFRCLKWWLRRRRIPVPKEGGYPSIVWTLMMLHVLRCSFFVDDADDQVNRGRALLGAMAAFFDRYAEAGLSGTFRFSGFVGAEFHPQSKPCQDEEAQGMSSVANFSVLDPTTTSRDSAAWGVEPVDLAPQSSAATHLLYSYELRRAQGLSAAALAVTPDQNECVLDSGSGRAFSELFADSAEAVNTLPTMMPAGQAAVIVLHGSSLVVGILQCIVPKPRWTAPFLHRHDTHSAFALHRLSVDANTGALSLPTDPQAEWFHPTDFVCMATLRGDSPGSPHLDAESLQRWRDLRALLPPEPAHALRRGACRGWRRKRSQRLAK